MINICMVTYNRLPLTKLAVEALLEKTGGDFFLHVVDNASTDGTVAYLEGIAARHENVRVFLLKRNMGVAVAANMGWAALDADYYVKLDNDVVVKDPDWLVRLAGLAENNKEIAQAGYLCGAWNYEITPAVLSGGDAFDLCPCCNGGCVLIPRRAYEKLGFWNEDYGFYGFEDLEYSERAGLAGLKCGYAPVSGAVEHMGYEPETLDAKLESSKRQSVAGYSRGEKLFVLNRFLFRRQIRPLYMQRKYLPVNQGGVISFKTNPEYLSLLRLQEELLGKIDYTVSTEGVSLDVAALSILPDNGGGAA